MGLPLARLISLRSGPWCSNSTFSSSNSFKITAPEGETKPASQSNYSSNGVKTLMPAQDWAQVRGALGPLNPSPDFISPGSLKQQHFTVSLGHLIEQSMSPHFLGQKAQRSKSGLDPPHCVHTNSIIRLLGVGVKILFQLALIYNHLQKYKSQG